MKVRDVIDLKGNLISREIVDYKTTPDLNPLISYYADQLNKMILDENKRDRE